jgi:glycosyltransferase involved in cell wall biosynthesis
MHIVIIANGFQEDYIINLLNGLSNKVERIDFIGSSIYPESKIDKRIHLHNLRGSHDENVGFLSKIERILSYYLRLLIFLFKTPAKTVHIQWLRFNFFEGIILTLVIKMLGKKAVYTAHDVLPHSKNNAYNRSLFKLIYKIQDEIIVHSDFIKKRIVNEFNINKNKITLVKHGLYKITESPAVSRDVAREKFGYNLNQLVILFFGIITKYKGLDLLLEAFTRLEAILPDIQLLIAGRVSQEYRNEYDNLIQSYNSDRITKIARHIKEEEVEQIFKAADLVVLPYTEASQSGVLFMSYAYGKPVIAPSLGGFPDDIETGKTGFLFEPFNIDSLAAAIQEYIRNWNSDSSYIREFAQRNYSWDSSAECLVRIYMQV